MNEETNGRYHVQLKNRVDSWELIPDSTRVFVDGGCAMVYNENDELIIAYASGEWAHIVSSEMLETMGYVSNTYGDLP